jgi:hypothetical protein
MKKSFILFLTCWLYCISAYGQTGFYQPFNGSSLPPGWTSAAVTGGPWELGNPSNNPADYSVETLPEHTGNNGFYVWMDFSNSDDDVILTSPSTDISSLTTPYLSFAYESFIGSDLNFSVGDFNFLYVEAWTGAAWTPIDTLRGNTPSGWDVLYYDLTGFTYAAGDSARVRFIADASSNTNRFWNDLLLDDIRIAEMSSCQVPGMPGVTVLRSDGFDVAWMTSTAASWEVSVAPVGAVPSAATTTTVTTNTATIAGLTPDTEYTLAIRAICAPGDTSMWSFVRVVRTACGALVPNYSFNFPNFINDERCWSEAQGRLGTSTVLSGTTSGWTEDGFANNGTQDAAREAISGTSNDEWLISESIDLGTGTTTYELAFDIALTGSGSSTTQGTLGSDDTIAVVISTDDGATWSTANILQQWNAGTEPSNTGDFTIISLAGYTGVVKFGFYAASTITNASTNVFIDNFEVRLPVTCLRTTPPVVSNVSAFTADINWNNNSPATQWQITYGPAGFAPGTGMTMGTVTNPTTISGLSDDTDYDVYVRAICTPGDTSAWSPASSFRTLCAPATPPYLYDFTDFINNDPCWAEAQGRLGTSTVLSGTTSGWFEDGFGNIGTQDAAREAISGTSNDEWLISRSVDLGTGTTTYELAFDIALTGSGSSTNQGALGADDTVAVVISTDNGATWSTANILQQWNAGTEPSNTGDFITINLAGYTGVVRFGFYAASTVSNASTNVFIDNFEVRLLPSCPRTSDATLSNITSSSVDVSWMNNGVAAAWEIEYGPIGFALGSGTSVTTLVNPTTLLGLSDNTDYEVYVRAICAPGDTSGWSNPTVFSTPCAAVTPTYLYDFATYLDPCWQEAEGFLTSNSSLAYGTSTWVGDDYRNTGSNQGANVNIFSTNRREWLISRSVDLSTGGPYQVEFDIALTNYNNITTDSMGVDDTLAFVISTDNGVTWDVANALRVWTKGNEPSNAGDRIIINLSAYTGVVKFGYYAASTVSNTDYDIHIDNFLVLATPSCPRPSALNATNITTSSLDLSWTENGSATEWEIEYGPLGYTPGTGMNLVTTTNPTTLSGLMPSGSYDVYVRAICSPTDTSGYSPVGRFFTTCDVVTPPYREEFVAYLPNCWEEGEGRLSASTVLTGTTSDWGATPFANATNGSPAAGFNLWLSSQNEWLVSPSIDLGTGATPYELNFDIALTEHNTTAFEPFDADDTIAVVISTDNGATWERANVLQYFTQGSEPSTTGDNVTISLVGYTGVVKIAFHASSASSVSDLDVFIDNFEVRLAPTRYVDLVITEIMYNSPELGADTLEFFEIYNNGPTVIDLDNVTLSTGTPYTFPSFLLGPGDYFVTAVNTQAFANVYATTADDQFVGGLANGGRLLLLRDPAGNVVDSVDYDDGGVWPSGSAQGEADGGGASIVLCDPNSDNADGANWSASANLVGVTINGKDLLASPGQADVCRPPSNVSVDTMLLDEVYCNTSAISGAFIISNNSTADESNVAYNVTIDGTIIGSGTIANLAANSSDTIAVGPVSVVTGTGMVQAYINAVPTDTNNTDDTLSKMVFISNIDASVMSNSTIVCNGDSTGQAMASTTDAYGMSTYMWNTGDMTASISNLPAGTYVVTATDSIGCMSMDSVTITEPMAIMIMDSITNTSCNGDSTGGVNLTVTGGTGVISYLWSNGMMTTDIMNVPAGAYSVTATDANGCEAINIATVVEPAPITITDTTNNVLCNGDSTGSVMILSTIGGTAPYTYMWSNGMMTMNAMNLPAGSYMLTVTDANGCMTMESYTITEPTALALSIMDNNDGTATAMPTGGVTPYTYQWDATAGNQTTATATNLQHNTTYMVTVVDANGCETMDSIDITFINVQNIDLVNSLSMFPNPTSNQVFVDLDLAATADVQISITNAIGQVVSTTAIGNVQTQRVELSTKDLPAGLYLVQFQIGEERLTRKLIVRRD